MTDTRYTELPDLYPANVRLRLQPNEAWLAQYCGHDPSGNYLVRLSSGTWMTCKKLAPACAAMIQHWGGPGSPHNLSDKTIKDFLKSEMLPFVAGFMPVPTSDAPAIQFKGKVYINSWDASSIMPPDAEAAADPALHGILTDAFRMMRQNLCGRPNELTLPEMLAAAQGDDPEEVQWRFFMNFLAYPLQNIGANMQVNMWLLGRINGLGRGTLIQLLTMIYGSQNVADLSQSEIERGGWTDRLVGKLLVIINELTVKDFDWNAFIKGNSCEGIIPIRKRNHDSFDALNFANWVFTSNDEEPRCLDSRDRRNALLQCYSSVDPSDRRALDLALAVYDWTRTSEAAQVRRFLGAIVHLLHQHKVDKSMIDYAPDTVLKKDVQEATSADVKGLYWLQNDDSYPRDASLPASEFMHFYNRYANKRGQVDARGMGGIMAGLQRYGVPVIRNKRFATKAAYWEIPSQHFPRECDVDAETRAKAHKNVVALLPRRII